MESYIVGKAAGNIRPTSKARPGSINVLVREMQRDDRSIRAAEKSNGSMGIFTTAGSSDGADRGTGRGHAGRAYTKEQTTSSI